MQLNINHLNNIFSLGAYLIQENLFGMNLENIM